jgi:exosome complex RNA-binding protein Csl4
MDVMKEDNTCPHEIAIHDLGKQAERLDKFISDAEPLLDYVRAEIIRNNSRTAFYTKITENVLGAGVLFVFASIGAWTIAELKLRFFNIHN